MNDTREDLKTVQANRKFWEYMSNQKDKIMREELEKVEIAKLKFREMFRKLQSAPKKLIEAQKNEKILQVQLEKEREIPANNRQEVLSLVEQMKANLRKLGIAC